MIKSMIAVWMNRIWENDNNSDDKDYSKFDERTGENNDENNTKKECDNYDDGIRRYRSWWNESGK